MMKNEARVWCVSARGKVWIPLYVSPNHLQYVYNTCRMLYLHVPWVLFRPPRRNAGGHRMNGGECGPKKRNSDH